MKKTWVCLRCDRAFSESGMEHHRTFCFGRMKPLWEVIAQARDDRIRREALERAMAQCTCGAAVEQTVEQALEDLL